MRRNVLFEGVRAGVLAGVTLISPAESFANNQTWIGPESSVFSTGQAGKTQREKSRDQELKKEKYKWEIKGDVADIWIENEDGVKTHLSVFCNKIIIGGVENFRILIKEFEGNYIRVLSIESREVGRLSVVPSAFRESTTIGDDGNVHSVMKPEKSSGYLMPKSLDALRALMDQNPKFAIMAKEEVKRYIWYF